MKKLKAHKNRLRINHKRFPWETVFKEKDGTNAKCKYCFRTPLVGNFDMSRTINNKDEFSCLECYQANRTAEDMREKGIGKVLENDETPFRNGDGGPMCGGVVSKSLFDSDPWFYMMAYYMEDDKFVEYKTLKKAGKDKEATAIFEKYAKSAI